jgi:hypothetical protein
VVKEVVSYERGSTAESGKINVIPQHFAQSDTGKKNRLFHFKVLNVDPYFRLEVVF